MSINSTLDLNINERGLQKQRTRTWGMQGEEFRELGASKEKNSV